jgi:predicted amidohydrolase YtcJ
VLRNPARGTRDHLASRSRHWSPLEAGKRADFVVPDANPLEAEPKRITGIKVLAAVLGGTPAYQPTEIFRS